MSSVSTLTEKTSTPTGLFRLSDRCTRQVPTGTSGPLSEADMHSTNLLRSYGSGMRSPNGTPSKDVPEPLIRSAPMACELPAMAMSLPSSTTTSHTMSSSDIEAELSDFSTPNWISWCTPSLVHCLNRTTPTRRSTVAATSNMRMVGSAQLHWACRQRFRAVAHTPARLAPTALAMSRFPRLSSSRRVTPEPTVNIRWWGELHQTIEAITSMFSQ
mmetsp:Transcript_53651/g.151116  ORF Transcript_53651/g.151116 Transcript_53651/m.151116 type:complete len:215 (-) Transcript_53651:190-834(-)